MIQIKSYGKAKNEATSSGGGGSFASSGNAFTTQWVEDNYVSKSFFNQLFTVHDANSNAIVEPNNTTTQIGNIEARYGLWSYSFISALGLNGATSGGGGGGATSLNQLSDVSLTSPTNGQALLYDSSTGLWKNGTVSGGGGGTGSVTSVAMSVPTGFSISGSPITSSGTLAVTFASGYKLPTTSKQNTWDTAATNVSTVMGYFNSSGAALEAEHAGLSDTAAKLSTTSKTAWGQQYWTSSGVPTSISGDMTNVGDITTASSGGSLNGFHSIEMNTNGSESGTGGIIDFHYNGSSSNYTSRIMEDTSGRIRLYADNGLRIGNGVIKWDTTNSCLKIEKYDGSACDVYATGGVSALGLSTGSSTVDAMTFDNITVNNRLYINNYGSITYSGGAMKLSSPQSIKINSDDVIVDPAGGVHALKFYLSGTTYLFVDGSTLKFWNGSAEKSVIVT